MAPTRPNLSARMPVTSDPAARPSRLFARVRVPSAVARMDSWVRLVTIAPAGPAVPAAKKTPMASSSSWTPPCGREKPMPRKTSEAVV